jgi:hypothetical protein
VRFSVAVANANAYFDRHGNSDRDSDSYANTITYT